VNARARGARCGVLPGGSRSGRPMLDALRARLRQGTATVPVPAADVAFPERFRGRPRLGCRGCETGGCLTLAGTPPTQLLRRTADGAVLDLGACLFAPEEEVGTPECGIRFTHDLRLAASTREDLLQPADAEPRLAAALDAEMRRLFGRSLRLRSVVAGSCNGCEAELVALGNVVFDLGRFGVQFVASPRHADGIVITGAVNRNMRDALERTYAAVPDPRLVIAVGACASSGGPFRESPEVLGGVPKSIRVDLWIPGCPPHPLTVLDGVLRLLGRLG
jgi:Ni,Fe-hydrogenase III small subunit